MIFGENAEVISDENSRYIAKELSRYVYRKSPGSIPLGFPLVIPVYISR